MGPASAGIFTPQDTEFHLVDDFYHGLDKGGMARRLKVCS